MFDSDEDKLIYLAGCALTGTASAPADIGKITKQAYGIAEEMLTLINKLKQTPEQSIPGQPAAAASAHAQSVGTSGQSAQVAGSATPDQPVTGPLSIAAAAAKAASAASESKTLVVAKAAHDQKSARDEKLATVSADNATPDFEIARESMKPALASKELAAKDLDAKEITAKVAAAKESIAKELAAKAAAGGRDKDVVSSSGNGKVDSGKESVSVVESSRGEELSKTHDKGWNYTPWGRS